MGVLEERNKKRSRHTDVQRTVLSLVMTAGMISVAALAPNVVGAMAKMGFLPSRRRNESVSMARNRLIQKGWLTRDKHGYLHITEAGEHALLMMQAYAEGLPKPKKWDGKWRILIFDIPHRRGTLRNKLRNSLQTVGFILLQKSVWVFPYECEDFIELLKADFKVGKDMRYIIAETIEGDGLLLKHFGLRKK